MHLSQAFDPMLPQSDGHLAKHQGLVLVSEGLLGDLQLEIHVLFDEVTEEDIQRLLGPAGARFGGSHGISKHRDSVAGAGGHGLGIPGPGRGADLDGIGSSALLVAAVWG